MTVMDHRLPYETEGFLITQAAMDLQGFCSMKLVCLFRYLVSQLVVSMLKILTQ
jgi:hypothetical protein